MLRGREKFAKDGPKHPRCKPADEMSAHLPVPISSDIAERP